MSLGSDPEVALYDKDKKAYISAHDLIPGTKEKPYKIKRGAVQVDGTALEFNIDPCSCASEFEDNLSGVLEQCKEMLPKHVEMRFDPAVEYDKDYFKKLPKKVLELGCDPDYNFEKGQMNPVPRQVGTMRTFGGHIHLGWGKGYRRDSLEHFWDCREMTKRLDQYFQLHIPFWDRDDKRQSMYGRMGAFRPKTFGVEYRSMSNAWLKEPKLWPWIYNSTEFIFKHALNKSTFYYNQYQQATIHARRFSHYDPFGQPLYVGGYNKSLQERKAQVKAAIHSSFASKDAPEFPL